MGVHAKGLGGWCLAILFSVANLTAADNDLRLVEAVKQGDQEAVLSLLQENVDVNAAQADGATALAWAAYRDNLETAELLIRAGADVSAANDYGVTPLSLACTNRNAAMVGKLLAAGADPNVAQWTGETPLMTCASTGTVEAVKSLLAHGADVNVTETQEEQTALMWAAAERYPEIVRALVEHGADVHSRSKTIPLPEPFIIETPGPLGFNHPTTAHFPKTKGGFTPLMFAAQQGDVDSARILQEAGADVNESTPGKRQRFGVGDGQRPRKARHVSAAAGRGPECKRWLWSYCFALRAARRIVDPDGRQAFIHGPFRLGAAQHAGIGEGTTGTWSGSERSNCEELPES